MEAYIIIISAAITAIAIAYKIANNLKNNTEGFKTFPMVMTEGNYVLSFPIVSSNTRNGINPVNAVKVYLRVKEIDSIDINAFTELASSINWHSIINSIINKTEIEQLDCSLIGNIKLLNAVIIECSIELELPIKADILINTDLTINIINN
jgi:hypothetical protein